MSAIDPPTIESVGGRQEFVTTGDGTRVRFARFRPEAPMARTLLLPGFTEFIEKHLETIAELLERRHEVLCVDWRGQGLSDRALTDRHRGHIVSMELFLSDLREILEATEFGHDRGELDLNVIGHSMGGHLALRAAAEVGSGFDRIIAIAPMIDIQTGHFPRALSPWLARIAVLMGLASRYPPGAGGYGAKAKIFEGNLLTRDKARFQKTHAFIARDPRLALGNPTFAWINAAFDSINRLAEPLVIERIRVPVLIFRAGQDHIVSNPAQERLCRALPDARLVDVDEAKHEILNETDAVRDAFWREADAFLGR
jgi:lysophospholipase